jgi:hypothetical protein
MESRPVYVSRARLPRWRRPIVGEDLLEDALSSAGWRVVHPETMSQAEQAEVVSSPTSFAGPVWLGDAQPAVQSLARGRVPDSHPTPFDLSAVQRARPSRLLVPRLPRPRGMPDLGFKTPLRLEVESVASALDFAVDPALQERIDKRHQRVWAEVRLDLAIEAGEGREALADLRRHYRGPMTDRLRRRAETLGASAEDVDRRPARSRRSGAVDSEGGARPRSRAPPRSSVSGLRAVYYLRFLRGLHERLAPPTYLEIGVHGGRSLALARCPSVGIDPAFKLKRELSGRVRLFEETSDAYFEREQPLAPFGGLRCRSPSSTECTWRSMRCATSSMLSATRIGRAWWCSTTSFLAAPPRPGAIERPRNGLMTSTRW